MNRIQTILLLILIIIAIGIVAVATRTPDGPGDGRAADDGARPADTLVPAADTTGPGGSG